jgi:hypothetical protein
MLRPGAPRAISVKASKRRLTVSWVPPESPGTYAVSKYRARAYLKSGSKLKWRATCYASASKLTCRTKTLAKGKLYSVRVWARNKAGYGAVSATAQVVNK